MGFRWGSVDSSAYFLFLRPCHPLVWPELNMAHNRKQLHPWAFMRSPKELCATWYNAPLPQPKRTHRTTQTTLEHWMYFFVTSASEELSFLSTWLVFFFWTMWFLRCGAMLFTLGSRKLEAKYVALLSKWRGLHSRLWGYCPHSWLHFTFLFILSFDLFFLRILLICFSVLLMCIFLVRMQPLLEQSCKATCKGEVEVFQIVVGVIWGLISVS